jgi:hypothetical protein
MQSSLSFDDVEIHSASLINAPAAETSAVAAAAAAAAAAAGMATFIRFRLIPNGRINY